MTLSDALDALFARYGFCYETNVEVYMEGLDGAERMAALMNGLRENPPASFADVRVACVGDYLRQTFTEGGTVRSTGLPRSNVLSYRLENGDLIVARPSGTEPKIKFYFLLHGENEAQAKQKADAYHAALNRFAGI